MKDLVFFIPAQETNKYHKLGDLAPFGDTTLLQWKISQCKKVVGDDCITYRQPLIRLKTFL